MSKRVVKAKVKAVKNLRLKLFLIPAIAFLIKLIIIAKIQGHAWYGADTENYFNSLDGLKKDGIFSQVTNLHYWPAGYPILLWIFSAVHSAWLLPITAIWQSLLYFAGCAFFVDQLRLTRLVRYSFYVALILSFNPTLALNTIALGYELPTAALLLLAVGFMIQSYLSKSEKTLTPPLIWASIAIAFASFMQPRLLLIGFVLLLIWGLATQSRKAIPIFLIASLAITTSSSVFMIARNMKANGFAAISTNLGTTMNIGAGDASTGGYTNKATGVPCDAIEGNSAQQDSHRVNCVLSWYAKNPGKGLKLIVNKAGFFWSPWFGPIANGTMARNPWLKMHPFKERIKTQEGFNSVYGNSGKLISWAWLLGTLALMFWGFWVLWKANGLERLIGVASFSIVVINWLVSMATIGDHRFRLPTMGLSLFLQVIGFIYLMPGGKSRLVPAREGQEGALRWKSLTRKAKVAP